MTRSRPIIVEGIFWFLLTALGYYILASVSLYATKGADNIAAVWPPSGYFLALLLLMPAQVRIAAFAGMAAASLGANVQGGVSVGTALAFSFANGCEAVVALWLLRKREPDELSFMAPRAVISFCLAAGAGSIVSAAVAWGLAGFLTESGHSLDFFLSWLTTVLLGMLIVTPPIVMLARLFETNALGNASAAMKTEATSLLTGTGLITIWPFPSRSFRRPSCRASR